MAKKKKSVGRVARPAPAPPAPPLPPVDKRTCSVCGNSLNFKGTYDCGVCKKKRIGECCYGKHPCK